MNSSWDDGALDDGAHLPTRKVDSMSSLVAEMIVTSLDDAPPSAPPATVDVSRLVQQPAPSWPAPRWTVHAPVGAPERGPRTATVVLAMLLALLLFAGGAVAAWMHFVAAR
ncbi:MAG: hypothetical protein KF819_28940 [Labilithrix sp.]|nr:hypothetical protein [Labilithrix sp.]